MDNEHIRLRTVIETMILATIGFLALQTYNMYGTLSELKGQMSGSSQRVDRIASVLPDIRVKVASEELKRPYSLAVVTSKAVEISEGKWAVEFHVIDPKTKHRYTVTSEVDGPSDRRIAYFVQGIASDEKADAVQLAEIVNLQLAEGSDVESLQVPVVFDERGSFIVRNPNVTPDAWVGRVTLVRGEIAKHETSLSKRSIGTLSTELYELSKEIYKDGAS